MNDITRILSAIDAGDPQASERLLPLVYEELRQLAAKKLAQEAPGQTLQATALVHEAYVRLVGNDGEQRRTIAATFSRPRPRRCVASSSKPRAAKERIKHGGEAGAASPSTWINSPPRPNPGHKLIELHDALVKLAAHDALKAKLVELRFFAGLTLPEAAACLGISPSTADRAWRYARAWLYAAMEGEE